MASYDYKCKKCNLVFEVEHKMTEKFKGSCPKCYKWWLPFIKPKVVQVFHPVGVVYSDEIPIGGYSVVDKRHQDGIYWDSPTAKKEAEEVKRAGKEDGFKWAKKAAEQDEKALAGQYRPVTEKEAMDILKDPNRKQDVHVVKPPTQDEFGIN